MSEIKSSIGQGFEDVEDIIDALDSVTWYNGLAKEILAWKDLPVGPYGIISPEINNPQVQVIWILCVILFGDYGTSPRFGWIEKKQTEYFYDFIDAITVTSRKTHDE